MRPLKICLVGLMPFPEGGAPTSRLRSLALGLQEAGAETSLIAFSSISSTLSVGFEKRFLWRGISCVCYGYQMPLRFLGTRVEGKQIIRRLFGQRVHSIELRAIQSHVKHLCLNHKIDVLIFYNQDPSFALALARLCRKNGICFVQQYAELHLQDDYPNRMLNTNYLREQLHLRLVPKYSDGVITISRYLEQQVKNSGAKNVCVIPALTNTELRADSIKEIKSKDSFVLTYLGRGDRRDCIDDMLQAAAAVKGKGYQFRFQMMGLKNENCLRIRDKVQEMGLDRIVEIAGWVEDGQMDDMYKESDAFILLRSNDRSSWACFPTRLPELLLYGKPVILSDVGDIHVYFTSDKDALFVTPGSIPSVANAIIRLIDDHEFRLLIGKAGKDLCQVQFSYQARGKEIFNFLLHINK